MTSGIHHVTLITRRVQANVDFYVGFLGLRLVKRTGGYADAEQLHLFYGDRLGSPGSLISFFVWEDGAPGRVGHGQVGEIALAVPKDSLGLWLSRAMEHRVAHESPSREFGETVLRLRDPDGVIVKLVGADLPAAAPLPLEIAPTRIRAVTLLTETPEETAAFVARFGYREGPKEGAVRRMLSDTDAVDVRDAGGFYPGGPGAGTADHVAFRAPDLAALKAKEAELRRLNSSPTEIHDRDSFTALYVRDPGGILIELATDGPGLMGPGETEETLGERLFMPPEAANPEDLRIGLPQFALPGEPRRPRRELPFVHRFRDPEDPDGSTLVLLHGSGGMEADLMPFAFRAAPRATLLALRGRSLEEGSPRWFRRLPGGRFDQADLREEAQTLAWTLEEAARVYGLDAALMTGLGWSNGANLLGAALLLHPGALKRAVLLRPAMVLEADPPQPPAAPERGARILALTGASDPSAEPLLEALRRAGAAVEARRTAPGHALTPADEAAVRDWLAADSG